MKAQQEMNFNSTMVRLKETASEGNSRTNWFQFHYGTIKRALQRSNKGTTDISIPLWYD